MSDLGWKSKVIPREDLTAYQRWELPLVDEEERAAHEAEAAESEQNHLPTAEEIEAIQQQAYDEAYEQGLNEGRETGKSQGHKEGYDAGWEQGLAEGRNDIQSRASRLELLMTTLAEPLEELDYRVEQELVTLASAVARHLVRRELKTDPGQIVATVREAIGALPAASRKIRVYLHPEDVALVREALSLNDEEMDDDARWRVLEEPVLTRGGCRVETEHSRIDATVESRLAEAIAQMLGGERESDDDNAALIPTAPPEVADDPAQADELPAAAAPGLQFSTADQAEPETQAEAQARTDDVTDAHADQSQPADAESGGDGQPRAEPPGESAPDS